MQHSIAHCITIIPRTSRGASRVAYIRKVPGGWRAEVERLGVRDSKTLPVKAAASAWAAKREAEILAGEGSQWPRKTVGDALERYGEDVSARKRSGAAELLRLAAIRRDFPALAGMQLHEVTTADIAAWRDARLRKVSRSSVQRDANLLRHVWSVAAREWRWCPEPTPWRALRMPGDNPPRQRLASWREIRRILRRCGFVTGRRPVGPMQEVGWAFLVALRTAMRAGEVLSLAGESVNLRARVVTLETHKTVEQVGRRVVPLTPAGHRVLSALWRPGPLFDIGSASLDTLFRKAARSQLIAGLHFHDSRGTALTHMARRMDVLTLARISGHRDLQLLLAAYYRETPEQIAARLASPRR